ncbi:MAG: rhomboid family intramembrane serine protease, partial [Myxococcales bacterium]|nr:rhomboid family intramembrane serine protease [Myxococcales bacterium]
LHVGFAHVTSNSVPFLVMGWLLLLRGIGQFFAVLGLVTVMEGVAVWLVGAGNSVHLGASGVVFGFFGFLLVAGVLERSVKSILSALIVGFAYGGIVWGVLPNQRGISWEGHLFGMLAGGVVAYWLVGKSVKEENRQRALPSG